MPPRRTRTLRNQPMQNKSSEDDLPKPTRLETENPFDITSGSVRPSTPRPPLKQVAPRKPFLPIFTTSKPTVPGYQPKPLPSSPVLDPDSPFQDISVSIRQSTPRPEVGRHALHTLRFLARSPTPERAPTPDPVAPPALITSPVRAPSPAANRAPVSPLPPSSPPSVSSDDQNPQPGSLPRPEFVEYEVQVDHHSSDDPFGFFAAERKIKAKRELTRPASHITLSDPPSPAPLPEPEQANQIDSDEELYTDRPAAPSPPPRALSHASTITPASSPPRHGPSTPPARARRVKRGRPVSLAQSEASSHTASVSPSKSVIAATKVAHDTPVAKRLRRTKGKENWDAGDSDPPTPPIALLGPARRAARAAAGSQALPAKGKGKAKAVIDDEESEDEPRAKRRKPVSRGTKRAAAKPRSRGVRTKKPVEKEVETDEDEEERRARQRQERLDYYKKLKDYRLATEKVYVL